MPKLTKRAEAVDAVLKQKREERKVDPQRRRRNNKAPSNWHARHLQIKAGWYPEGFHPPRDCSDGDDWYFDSYLPGKEFGEACSLGPAVGAVWVMCHIISQHFCRPDDLAFSRKDRGHLSLCSKTINSALKALDAVHLIRLHPRPPGGTLYRFDIVGRCAYRCLSAADYKKATGCVESEERIVGHLETKVTMADAALTPGDEADDPFSIEHLRYKG